MYRHGDLLLIPQNRPRANWPRKVDKFDGIILRGESTGHAHRLRDAESVTAYGDLSGIVEVELHGPNSLIHEEHKEIVLPEGRYTVIRQREYEGDNWRNVRD